MAGPMEAPADLDIPLILKPIESAWRIEQIGPSLALCAMECKGVSEIRLNGADSI